jgi:hypothetical protein
MIRKLSTALGIGTLITAAAVAPAAAQTEPVPEKQENRIELLYNALEIGPNQDGSIRARLWTMNDLYANGTVIGIDAFNETNDFEKKTLFGRQALSIGKADSKWRAIAWTKTTNEGSIDTKFGIRNYGIPELLGCYGFIEATANNDAGNLTAFFGKQFNKTWTGEFFHEIDGSDNYTELQVNKDLGEHLRAFARAEFYDFDMQKATIIAGVTLKMPYKKLQF